MDNIGSERQIINLRAISLSFIRLGMKGNSRGIGLSGTPRKIEANGSKSSNSMLASEIALIRAELRYEKSQLETLSSS
jgi:hypothetical protein